ncbi:MAG TPA: alpha/beta hydrolase-fold protein [Mucilaginibacter sp.]|jgi:enterochelin esterase family protein
MKYNLTFIFLLILASAFGQAGNARSPFGGPRIVSPEVTDGKITFRLKAPNAKQVMVDLAGSPRQAMQKGDNGVWTLTTSALEPDIYPYTFSVDSVTMPDPGNPMIKPIYKTSAGQSLVRVPGPSTLSWEINDVPHGNISHHFYKSTIIGDDRDYYVYTPPGYDAKRKEPYPVLYLFHGVTDEASAWTAAGRANFILDNLIAEGKAEPMIIVNTLGYGNPDNIMTGTAFGKFGDALLHEVIPQVEKEYHASKSASKRAVAGLSMGGAESLMIGLNHPDVFNYVGAFSSAEVMYGAQMRPNNGTELQNAPVYQKVFPDLNSDINKSLKLLWISCGTEDFLININREYKSWLTSKGVKYTAIETPGAHTWMVWRRNLTAFAPLLFK